MDLYQPKNVLITGSAGFIGSSVSILLTKKYPHIRFINFDKLDYCSNLSNLDEIKDLPNFKFIKGDICSYDLVDYVLREENIDTVMHFAANSHVGKSFINTLEFTKNNVMGTHILLEACRNYGKITRLLHVSTDECYEYFEDPETARTENHKLESTNVYASSKLAAEIMVKSYFYSFNFPIIITRGNNVYGKFQYPEKIIPKFINQILKNIPLTIHGDGHNSRNYLHVDDVARAFELLLFKGVIGESYNIGSKNEIKNIDLAKKLITLMKPDILDQDKLIVFTEDRNFNDKRYFINSDKLKLLGWKEEVTWDEGINSTIEWYRRNLHQFKNLDEILEAHSK